MTRALLLALAVGALACATEEPNGRATNMRGGTGGTGGTFPECSPSTCTQLGAVCGELLDPCGAVLSCGDCLDGQTCGASSPNECGQGTCAPKTCAQRGASCGLVSDGCASVIDCGECPAGAVCGAVAPNQCDVPGGGGSGGAPGTGGTLGDPACLSTWKASAGTHLSEVAATDSGKLLVVGESEEQAWIGSVSACSGALEASRTIAPAGASWSRAMAIATSGGAVMITGHTRIGTDPNDAMAARLDASNLGVHWVTALHDSDESDEGWDVGVTPDGSFWVAGTSRVESGAVPWAIRGDASGATCGFPATAGVGVSRALTVSGGSVYVAGATDGHGFVARVDASSCSASPSCSCAPSWTSGPVQVGAVYTEVRGLVELGGSLFVAGFALDVDGTNDYKAFVARVDGSTGGMTGTWAWNPTALFDGILGIATDGQAIYVAMVRAYDGVQDSSASAHLAALPTSIDDTTIPLWSADLPFMNGAWDVEVGSAGEDAVYVVGRSETAGWVARCTKNGACPK